MKLSLRVLSEKKYGQRIVVEEGQSTTVGRSNAAQNSFDDDHMSSLHFEIENFGSHAEVRDLRSTNRTWLNNNFVTSAPLKHGDRLRAGKTVLVVEMEQSGFDNAPEQPPLPPASAGPAGHMERPAGPMVAKGNAAPRPPVEFDARPRRSEPLPSSQPKSPAYQPLASLDQSESSQETHRPRYRTDAAAPAPASLPPPLQPLAAGVGTGTVKPGSPNEGSGTSLPGPVPTSHVSAPAAVSAAVVRPSGEARRPSASPIESVEFKAPPERQADSSPLHRTSHNPIVESSSLFFGSPAAAGLDKRRFRQYSRVGDFQTLHHLRSVITALNARKSVRVIVHFAKLRMIAPALTEAVPLCPYYPGAATHWPVCLTYRDWESESVQSVAKRLCSHDALLVLVGEFNVDLATAAQEVGAAGVPGFCEAGGFLGWSWPSAFHWLLQIHGAKRWGEILGSSIDGVITCSPIHSEVLTAFAAECLEGELRALGFAPAS